MRASIMELSGAVASETGVIVAAAIVPIAGGAMDAGEKLLDSADEITDKIEDSASRAAASPTRSSTSPSSRTAVHPGHERCVQAQALANRLELLGEEGEQHRVLPSTRRDAGTPCAQPFPDEARALRLRDRALVEPVARELDAMEAELAQE